MARCCWVLFEIQSTTNGQRNGRQDLIERELTPNQWIWQGSERFKKSSGSTKPYSCIATMKCGWSFGICSSWGAAKHASVVLEHFLDVFLVFWSVWSPFGVQSPTCWLAFFSRVYHLRIHQVAIKFTSNGRSFPAEALKSCNFFQSKEWNLVLSVVPSDCNPFVPLDYLNINWIW